MKKIRPYFSQKDDRGQILGISQDLIWKEINYFQSKKGTTRGNHYHKKTLEGFYIIAGKIQVKTTNLKTGQKSSFLVKKNSIFIIEPYELHTFEILEDSSWINMLSKSMKDNEDFYTYKI